MIVLDIGFSGLEQFQSIYDPQHNRRKREIKLRVGQAVGPRVSHRDNERHVCREDSLHP